MSSPWTVDTLKKYFEALLAEKDKQIALALSAAEKAVTKAETATDKRFDGVNEFRQTLSDQTKSFASMERVDAIDKQLNALSSQITTLTSTLAGRSGGLRDGYGWLIGLAGIAIAAVAYFK